MLKMHRQNKKHELLWQTLRKQKFRVALSLSSGGAEAMGRDLAFMEMIAELGIDWDEVHGTSAGASVGAVHAYWHVLPDSQVKPANIPKNKIKTAKEIREGFLSTTKFSNVFEPSLGAFRTILKERSVKAVTAFFSGRKLENKIMEGLESATFADAEKEVFIYAEREKDLGYEIFSKETHPHIRLHEAVRASLSIPFFFEPKEISGISYIDGGMLVNTPLWHIVSHHKKKYPKHPLLILACTNLYPYRPPPLPENFWELIKFRYYQKILYRNFYRELELTMGENKVFLWLFYPKREPIRSFAFHKMGDYMKTAKTDFYEHYFQFLSHIEFTKVRKKLKLKYPYKIPEFV
ncbi:MAG: hypothetical protein D6767_05735 [Candidatus Hydrogenedentota bacterium]|nr:MAG: hypothetical protein D6767_05735 [Candidatus Hydrogenedentota bacterium]